MLASDAWPALEPPSVRSHDHRHAIELQVIVEIVNEVCERVLGCIESEGAITLRICPPGVEVEASYLVYDVGLVTILRIPLIACSWIILVHHPLIGVDGLMRIRRPPRIRRASSKVGYVALWTRHTWRREGGVVVGIDGGWYVMTQQFGS